MNGHIFKEHSVQISNLANDATLTIDAKVYEVGGTAPADIISEQQDWYVRVEWTFAGRITRYIGGDWHLALGLESQGNAPEELIEVGPIPIDPCGNGEYSTVINVPKGTVKAYAKAGSVYNISLTLGATNTCGDPGLVYAHCTGAHIQVTP